MDFLIKFAQYHESFRQAEIEALAVVEKVDLTILSYDADSPYCTVRLPDIDSAKRLIRRSILANSIHHLWGQGRTLSELHASIKENSSQYWPEFKDASFKYEFDVFRGTRPTPKRVEIMDSFRFIPLDGPILLKNPSELFTVFEQWPLNSVPLGIEDPDRMYLGRHLATSSRDLMHRYDLKKRDYIATTSMDAELGLVTANMALAAPGKIFYDPFAGTGSFLVSCAHFGALTWGSDIDGRSMRGRGGKKSLRGNFRQYGLEGNFGDLFVADLTNTPLRRARILDGIVCDPPYGVREGLMVLGWKDSQRPDMIERSKKVFQKPDYVPPRRPYSFLKMLDDILVFATDMLVDDGRISFWMPTANDEEQDIPVPTHPSLELTSLCVQPFYKWSRRLITYRRIPDAEVSPAALEAYLSEKKAAVASGRTADDLNPFRANYFNGFRKDEEGVDFTTAKS